ncbi:MAG: site-specific tyrosine recombinase XerD [Gammaproteobacteria bacterium]|nr:site-specific tyrosine recombinase XerD [Gammaproteobacteria bacterium]|tara:strand:+ start:379 stop:1278 length:900 start_codon:yes stop_codon:yes gene_type:complete
MKNTLNNDYLDNFLDSIWAEQGLSKNTLVSYEHDIKSFLVFLDHNKIDLLSTQYSDISSFISMRFSKGISSRSNMRLISSLKKFFLYLLNHNFIKKNPTENIESPRNIKSLPHTIDIDSVDKLLNAPNIKTRFGSRDKAMLEILYACGLRVSELVTLKLSQVAMESNFLRVMGKGKKERIIPINDYALSFLSAYLKDYRSSFISNSKTDSLFLSNRGKEMTRHSFWHILKKYATQVGIQEHLSPHTLRHAFATHMINNGADLRVVQLLLGHSDLSTTQLYTHIAKNELKELHCKNHPRA